MLSDALIAVVVAFAGAGSELGNAHRNHHPAIAAAILGAMGLTLVGRRRFPGAVLVAVAAGAAVMSALGSSLEGGFLAVLVASYSAAVYGVRKLAAGLAVCGIAVFAGTAVAVLAIGHSLSGARPPLTTLLAAAGAWLVGFAVRRQYDLRDAQAALAAEAAERAADREREEVRRVRLAERLRIARELHDVVAHHISVVVIQAQGAQRVAERDPALARSAMAEAERTGRTALEEMRRLLGLLRSGEPGPDDTAEPEPTDDSAAPGPAAPGPATPPGLSDIDALAGRMRAAGLDVNVRTSGEPRDVPAGIGLAGYRIVQEALTNALKHAGPAHVTVRLDYADGLDILVADDGRGAAAALTAARVPGAGTGLAGMAERAAAAGGTLTAGPRPGGGFQVHASIPAAR